MMEGHNPCSEASESARIDFKVKNVNMHAKH